MNKAKPIYCSKLVGANYHRKFFIPGLREEFEAYEDRKDVILKCADGEFRTFKVFLAALSAFWKNIFEANDNDLDLVHVVSMPDIPVDVIERMHSLILKDWSDEDDKNVPDDLVDAINVYSQFMSEDEPILVPQIRAKPPRPIFRPDNRTKIKSDVLEPVVNVKEENMSDSDDDDFPDAFLGEDYEDEEEDDDENESKPRKVPRKRPKSGHDDDMFDVNIIFPSNKKEPRKYAHEMPMTDEQIQEKEEIKARIDKMLQETKYKTRSSKTFHCGLCNKDYTTKQALYNHVFTHQPDKKFECEECGKKFPSSAAVRYHRRIHGKNKHKCEHCDARFHGQSHLARHMRQKHFEFSDKKRFACDQCFNTYSDPNGLNRHKLIHSTDRPFKCTYCQKGFKTKPALRIHEVKKVFVFAANRKSFFIQSIRSFLCFFKFYGKWRLNVELISSAFTPVKSHTAARAAGINSPPIASSSLISSINTNTRACHVTTYALNAVLHFRDLTH